VRIKILRINKNRNGRLRVRIKRNCKRQRKINVGRIIIDES
jgi:hypothetical protein